MESCFSHLKSGDVIVRPDGSPAFVVYGLAGESVGLCQIVEGEPFGMTRAEFESIGLARAVLVSPERLKALEAFVPQLLAALATVREELCMGGDWDNARRIIDSTIAKVEGR